MQQLIKFLLSPLAFALGFLWPLVAQVTVALGWLQPGVPSLAVGAAVALCLGLMAQWRGSWLWIK